MNDATVTCRGWLSSAAHQIPMNSSIFLFETKKYCFLVKHFFTFIRCISRLNKCDHVKAKCSVNPSFEESRSWEVRHTDIEIAEDHLMLVHMTWDEVKWDQMRNEMKGMSWSRYGRSSLSALPSWPCAKESILSKVSLRLGSYHRHQKKIGSPSTAKYRSYLNRQIKTQFNVK